jgi:hypothetical protein
MSDDSPSGQAYVDTVVGAGQRSRALIYSIVVLMVLTFTCERVTYKPEWLATQISIYEDLNLCLKSNTFAHKKCDPLRSRIERFEGRAAQADDVIAFADTLEIGLTGPFGAPDFTELNKPAIDDTDERIKQMIAGDISNETITIPVLGSHIDVNDLWIVTGVGMLFLLYMLYASLRQEIRNIDFLKREKKEYLSLVLMNQVLTVPGAPQNCGVKFVERSIWLGPSLIYLYVVYADMMYYNFSFIVVGRERLIIELFVELIALALVVYYNVLCLRAQIGLEEMIAEIPATSAVAAGTPAPS